MNVQLLLRLLSLAVLLCLISGKPDKDDELGIYLKMLHDEMMVDWEDTVKHPKIKGFEEHGKQYVHKNFNKRLKDKIKKKKRDRKTKELIDCDDTDKDKKGKCRQKRQTVTVECTRKSIFALSKAELQAYKNTMTKWKTQIVDPVNVSGYDIYAQFHRESESPGAHFGPCFLPWHRVYLSLVEGAWKDQGSTSCLPFVNWPDLEQLPVPRDSCLFSPDYFGNSYGDVTTGFAANWKMASPDCGTVLRRNAVSGSNGKIYLYTPSIITSIQNAGTTYGKVCYPDYPLKEYRHGYCHSFMGGTMNSLSCSPNDPLFFSHHCYVDYLYQKVREQHAAVGTPYWAEYPDDAPPDKGFFDEMKPFHTPEDPIYCYSGLEPEFDQMYKYQDPPSTCTVHSNCYDRASYNDQTAPVFCNPNTSRCCSKVRIGGSCQGFTSPSIAKVVCFREALACGSRNATCDSATSTCRCPCLGSALACNPTL